MKKFFSIVLILTVFLFRTFGFSPFITWNLGTVDAVWNHMTQVNETTWSGDGVAVSFIDFQFHFINKQLGIQTSLIQFRQDEEKNSMLTFFPIEVNLNILKSDNFIFGPYARAEVNYGEGKIYPFAEAGIKIGILILNDPNKLRYSWRNSIYLGYDSKNRINIGTQIDIGVIGLLLLYASSKPDTK